MREEKMERGSGNEKRNAVRIRAPHLSYSVTLYVGGKQYEAVVRDESVGGLRFDTAVDVPIEVGTQFGVQIESDTWLLVARQVSIVGERREVGGERIECIGEDVESLLKKEMQRVGKSGSSPRERSVKLVIAATTGVLLVVGVTFFAVQNWFDVVPGPTLQNLKIAATKPFNKVSRRTDGTDWEAKIATQPVASVDEAILLVAKRSDLELLTSTEVHVRLKLSHLQRRQLAALFSQHQEAGQGSEDQTGKSKSSRIDSTHAAAIAVLNRAQREKLRELSGGQRGNGYDRGHSEPSATK